MPPKLLTQKFPRPLAWKIWICNTLTRSWQKLSPFLWLNQAYVPKTCENSWEISGSIMAPNCDWRKSSITCRKTKPSLQAMYLNIARSARTPRDFEVENPPEIDFVSKICCSQDFTKIVIFHENHEFSSPRKSTLLQPKLLTQNLWRPLAWRIWIYITLTQFLFFLSPFLWLTPAHVPKTC